MIVTTPSFDESVEILDTLWQDEQIKEDCREGGGVTAALKNAEVIKSFPEKEVFWKGKKVKADIGVKVFVVVWCNLETTVVVKIGSSAMEVCHVGD